MHGEHLAGKKFSIEVNRSEFGRVDERLVHDHKRKYSMCGQLTAPAAPPTLAVSS